MKHFDVESYVSSNLKRAKKGSTGQITAVCPWCEKYGSFYIDAVSGNYICFKCDEKGYHLVGVIARVEGITWREAKAFLLRRLFETRRKETIPSLAEKIADLREENEREEEKNVINLPEEFIPIYKNGRWRFPIYLKQRGIKKKTARAWGVGFCNRGRFRNRIVMPIVCPNGESFTSRDVTGKLQPKYLNPSKCFFQSHLLHGWPQVDIKRDVVLVEGPMDAIKLWQYGIQSLSLGGKVLHPKQIQLLAKCARDISITIMLDPEELTAPFALAEQLVFRFEQVYIATLPEGVDPGSSTREQAEEANDGASLYRGERGGKMLARLESLRKNLVRRYS